MAETTVRDAVPADVAFLREALGKLNDEMEQLSSAGGFRAEGSPGLNIEGCLQRDGFLIAVAGAEPRGFLSIYLTSPMSINALKAEVIGLRRDLQASRHAARRR